VSADSPLLVLRDSYSYLQAVVNFDRRRISFILDGDVTVSTPLPASLTGCPLYLHMASSGSFLRLDSYEFRLASNSAQTALAGNVQIPLVGSDEEDMGEVAESVEEEDGMQAEEEFAESPIPAERGAEVDSFSVEDDMMDVSAPDVSASSPTVQYDAESSSSSSSSFLHLTSFVPVESRSDAWSLTDCLLLLLLVCLLSMSSAHILALICQQVMA
jgi:hypothetical protein